MKTNLVLIGIIILSVASLIIVIQAGKINRLEMDNLRISNNLLQVLSDSSEITFLRLKKNEVIGRYKKERDSVLMLLKIRPKEIIRIVTNTITEVDTVFKEVPVLVTGPDRWFVSDTGKCHIWSGNVFLQDTSMNLLRTNFQYNNDIQIVNYKERPHRLWFIRWGRWIYKQDVSSRCGESYTKEVEFVK